MENALSGNVISSGIAFPRSNIRQAEKSSYSGHSTSLETLIAWFEDAEEATANSRKWSERDRDYYDHAQLTAQEVAELNKRGQPDVVINRIQPKINYLIGLEATSRTDPRAFPKTPSDEDASEAATDGLRYVEDAADLKPIFSNVWEQMLIEGFGGLELVIEESSQGQPEIKAVGWEWDRLFYDPHSRKADFSDARYVGGVLWLDIEDAKGKWSSEEQQQALDLTLQERTASQTYDDRPSWQQWSTGGKRKRVRIVQMYHREGGKWMQCIFTKGGKLETVAVPFVDQDGNSYCPMYLQSAFVNRKNERYGLVRSMIHVQDEINKRRSKALHRLSMRQVRSERGAVDDVELAKRELAKPDGWVETNPGFEFELLQTGDQLQAELTMLQEAKNEIELMGPNAAMQGKDDDAPSGRAILASQQGGQTEIALLLDRHRHLKRRVYIGIWSLIRQYKDGEWWVRVTDDEKNAKFVGFNKPVTLAEDLAKRAEQNGVPPEEFQAQMQQLQADPMQAQRLQEVVRVENQPTRMFMDISIEEVPDVANVAEEQFQALVKLAPAVTFPPKVYLKASSLRNKEQLLEELEGAQMSPEEAQLKQEVSTLELEKLRNEVAKMAAEVEKIRADAAMTMAKASAPDEAQPAEAGPTPAEVEVEALKAEAERAKADAVAIKAAADRELVVMKSEAEREKHALEMERLTASRAAEAQRASERSAQTTEKDL